MKYMYKIILNYRMHLYKYIWSEIILVQNNLFLLVNMYPCLFIKKTYPNSDFSRTFWKLILLNRFCVNAVFCFKAFNKTRIQWNTFNNKITKWIFYTGYTSLMCHFLCIHVSKPCFFIISEFLYHLFRVNSIK